MARNNHSGYPIKWFKDENAAKRAYECVICLEVLKDAVQVRDCGHQFCAFCIDDILKADPRCPSCRIEISEAMVFADHAARRLIKLLEVNCYNEGCTWTGCLGSLLQNHQNNCNFLIQRDDNNGHKLKLEELEQKHDTLMLDVFRFKEKHEQDITALKLKHEQEITELKLKHEEGIEELKLKLQQTEDLLRQMGNEEKNLCEKEIPQKSSPDLEENVTPVEIIPVESDKPLDENLSSEDKEEKVGVEIKVEKDKDADPEAPAAEQTRIKYERDFLLQFQYMPVCCEKPAGLPKIEIVLDSPVQPGKLGGGSQRQKSQGGGEKRGSRKTLPPVVLKRSENPWQRPVEREKELTEEEKKSAELYRNVMAILNKLTPQKFETLVEQVIALDINTPERLAGVTDRIFEKAIREPMYSAVYANMCRCLFAIKVADVKGKDVSFRKLLLNRCQEEFEGELDNQLEGLSQLNKFGSSVPQDGTKDMKQKIDEASAKSKRRMLGNMKFMGELFKLKLLTQNVMHDCIFKMLRCGNEKCLESMRKLLFTVGKDLDSDKAKPRIDQYFQQIKMIIITEKVSARVVFLLRDVVELRDNKWIPRREENYPKTIDQIHKEVELLEIEKAAQLPSKNNKRKKVGPGGRDSPKPMANDGWITPGTSQPIDQNKLRSMAKRANNEEISLCPSARFGQWGCGSSAGESNFLQEQDQPQGNRYSALSAGGDMRYSRPYDPRRSASGGLRLLSGGSRGSDKSRIKGRESAVEAARNPIKSRNEKPQATTQNLNFLLIENNDKLLKLLSADQFKNDTIFAFIEKHFKEEKRKEVKFINQLVTAVAESCIINKDEEAGPDCCKGKLQARTDILRKYLGNDIDLELEALFALQEIYVKYNKPAAMLSQFFNTLYDEEVLTKAAFMKWKQDESPSRQEAKGPALHATASFFEWLQTAAVEGGEN